MKGSRQGTNKLTSAKERLKAYLVGDDIRLTPDEIVILTRWEKADLLMRQVTPFDDAIKQMVERFNVSRFTAQNDIYAAMEIFAAARKVNKRYLLYLKYDRQMADLEAFRKTLYDGKKFIGSQKDVMALAKLEEAATYTLNSMPVEVEKKPFAPTKVTLNLVKQDSLPMQMSLPEALRLADEYIKNLPELEEIPPSKPSSEPKTEEDE